MILLVGVLAIGQRIFPERRLEDDALPARPLTASPAKPSEPICADKDSASFVGVVLPFRAVDVAAQLQAEVQDIGVVMGQSVPAGRVLFTLQSTSVTKSDISIAFADVKSAEAEVDRLLLLLQQARERLQRGELLNREGLTTAEQLEDVRYVHELAAAAVASARTTVEQKNAIAEQRAALMARLEVHAPFDGAVSMVYVDRGSTVAPGTPVLRLVRMLPLKLRFAVPGGEAVQLRNGNPVVATLSAVGVVLDGSISTIAPEVDSASQMVVVEATLALPNDSNTDNVRLLVGQSARVSVQVPVQNRSRGGAPCQNPSIR